MTMTEQLEIRVEELLSRFDTTVDGWILFQKHANDNEYYPGDYDDDNPDTITPDLLTAIIRIVGHDPDTVLNRIAQGNYINNHWRKNAAGEWYYDEEYPYDEDGNLIKYTMELPEMCDTQEYHGGTPCYSNSLAEIVQSIKASARHENWSTCDIKIRKWPEGEIVKIIEHQEQPD